MRRHFIPLLLILVCCCRGEEKENQTSENEKGDKINIALYRYNGEVGDAFQGRMVVNEDNEYVDYNYYPLDSNIESYVESVRVFLNKDSIILFNSDTAFLIDSKEFKVENENFLVRKYNWDLPDMYDEESHIYVVPGFGMVGYRNYPWGIYGTIYNANTKIEEAVISDTTGFFRKKLN